MSRASSQTTSSITPAGKRQRAWRSIVAWCIATSGCWVLLLILSPATRLALRTVLLLPSFFASLPGAPVDLISDAPIRTSVDLQPVDGFVRAHVYRPRQGRHAALILSLGLGPAPPDDPRVVRLMNGLARTGLVAVLLESEALDNDTLYPDLPQAFVEGAEFTAAQSYVRPDRIGLFGFSVGGSLALIAAARPEIRDRLRLVEAFGGYTTLEDALLSVSTHTLRDQESVRLWEPDPVARHHLADVLIAGLTDQMEAETLRGTFVEEDGKLIDQARLSPEGQAIFSLLTVRNREEGRRLLAALPASLQDNLVALSPLAVVPDVRAHIFVMYDRDDPLLPYTGSRDLCAKARSEGRKPYCSRFSIFQHVDPKRIGNPVAVMHDVVELYLHAFAILRRLQ